MIQEKNFKKSILVLSVGLFSHLAFAGAITDINVSAFPNNQKVIKIKFDKKPVKPKISQLGSPTQIALDFSKTTSALQQAVFEYEDPLLGRISAVQNKIGRAHV